MPNLPKQRKDGLFSFLGRLVRLETVHIGKVNFFYIRWGLRLNISNTRRRELLFGGISCDVIYTLIPKF